MYILYNEGVTCITYYCHVPPYMCIDYGQAKNTFLLPPQCSSMISSGNTVSCQRQQQCEHTASWSHCIDTNWSARVNQYCVD